MYNGENQEISLNVKLLCDIADTYGDLLRHEQVRCLVNGNYKESAFFHFFDNLLKNRMVKHLKNLILNLRGSPCVLTRPGCCLVQSQLHIVVVLAYKLQQLFEVRSTNHLFWKVRLLSSLFPVSVMLMGIPTMLGLTACARMGSNFLAAFSADPLQTNTMDSCITSSFDVGSCKVTSIVWFLSLQ